MRVVSSQQNAEFLTMQHTTSNNNNHNNNDDNVDIRIDDVDAKLDKSAEFCMLPRKRARTQKHDDQAEACAPPVDIKQGYAEVQVKKEEEPGPSSSFSCSAEVKKEEPAQVKKEEQAKRRFDWDLFIQYGDTPASALRDMGLLPPCRPWWDAYPLEIPGVQSEARKGWVQYSFSGNAASDKIVQRGLAVAPTLELAQKALNTVVAPAVQKLCEPFTNLLNDLKRDPASCVPGRYPLLDMLSDIFNKAVRENAEFAQVKQVLPARTTFDHMQCMWYSTAAFAFVHDTKGASLDAPSGRQYCFELPAQTHYVVVCIRHKQLYPVNLPKDYSRNLTEYVQGSISTPDIIGMVCVAEIVFEFSRKK